MTVRNSSRPIARVFRATAAPDAEMNCSKDFTPRLRLWSTVRWVPLISNSRASRRVGARSCVGVHLAGPRRGQGGVWRRVAAITSARGLLRTYDGLLGSPFSRYREFDDQVIRL